MRAEWSHVLELSRGRRAAIVSCRGAAPLMFPQFEPPVSWDLVPGLATRGDIGREAEQISRASIVVLARLYGWPDGTPPFARLRHALELFHPIYTGHFFSVLSASSPARSATLPRTRTFDGAPHSGSDAREIHRLRNPAPQRQNVGKKRSGDT